MRAMADDVGQQQFGRFQRLTRLARAQLRVGQEIGRDQSAPASGRSTSTYACTHRATGASRSGISRPVCPDEAGGACHSPQGLIDAGALFHDR